MTTAEPDAGRRDAARVAAAAGRAAVRGHARAAQPVPAAGRGRPRVGGADAVRRADRTGRDVVLLIERAHDMRSHAGQPAFPGGAVDPEDGGRSPRRCARRSEETGLDPAGVQVFGDAAGAVPAAERFRRDAGARLVARAVAGRGRGPGARWRRCTGCRSRSCSTRPTGSGCGTRAATSAPRSASRGLLVWGFTAGSARPVAPAGRLGASVGPRPGRAAAAGTWPRTRGGRGELARPAAAGRRRCRSPSPATGRASSSACCPSPASSAAACVGLMLAPRLVGDARARTGQSRARDRPRAAGRDRRPGRSPAWLGALVRDRITWGRRGWSTRARGASVSVVAMLLVAWFLGSALRPGPVPALVAADPRLAGDQRASTR